jgi:N-acetylneuraminic acid mutarotase
VQESARARATVVLAAVVLVVAVVVAATSPGHAGSASSSTAANGGRGASGIASANLPLPLSAVPIGALPAAVGDAAVAPLRDGRTVLLGGIGASQSSTDAITVLVGASVARTGALPGPQNGAQAARLGSLVYVFGGRNLATYDHILRYDPQSDEVTPAGALPTPAAGVAVTALSGTAYVIGGYDGQRALDTIVAWRPGTQPRIVGHLPFGLSYAAVAASGSGLIIAGGTEADDVVSSTIFSFDPATGAVRRIGELLAPLTHAPAVALDGQVIIIGGRHELDGARTATIIAVDPATGLVRRAGRLPQTLSDASAATVAGRIIVAGGQSKQGFEDSIIALSPR